MLCTNTDECFEQISAYFNGKKTGHFLIVNANNYDDYQAILQRLEADEGKEHVYTSEYTLPNGLPNVDQVISEGMKAEEGVLVGISQALMLRSESALRNKVDEILEQPITGYSVVLLDHCEQMLRAFMDKDLRVKNRVVIVNGVVSSLPRIKLIPNIEVCIDETPIPDFKHLLAYLEKITDLQIEEKQILTVVSSFSSKMFQQAVYSITDAASIYDSLCSKYVDIASATEESYGTDAQWQWLAMRLKGYASFSALICVNFGSTENLSIHLENVMGEKDENQKWLLWLALKVFGEVNNQYLSQVLAKSKRLDDFEDCIYFELISIDVEDDNFNRLFQERKRLIQHLPENLKLSNQYCEKLGRRQKNAVYYLTDETNSEKNEFVKCLSLYDYSEQELMRAVNGMSESLSQYMGGFVFDTLNTKLPDSDGAFRDELTQYFAEYKVQKLTNKIHPDFLNKVNEYAVSRPYNKLLPRSSIVSHMDKKDTQIIFFDALGVEYLSFIQKKCEEYGLMSEVFVGHCELPSITEKNKEFLQGVSEDSWVKIDDLDEMKHHSQIYNYQKCKYPLHLFVELDVIDEQLRNIQSLLTQEIIKKALVISDHGASRLAVLYGHEASANIELDESGEHSGRCCPSDEDPKLPYAAYEDGYSVIANYERFKGGRKANVEVHGGATLEETLVPIIMLTKKPENVEICFVSSVITLIPRSVPELILYSNVPLQKPRLNIGGDFIDGEFVADNKHAKFSLPQIKRKGTYKAEVYDGEKNMSIELEFKAQRQTREVDLL